MIILIPAIILFAVTYVLMLVFSKYRPYIAIVSGLIFIVSGMLLLNEIVASIVFNVLLMIAGTVVSLLRVLLMQRQIFLHSSAAEIYLFFILLLYGHLFLFPHS